MYRIGKLQTFAGSKLRLPCPLIPLLEVIRLTGQRNVSTKSWAGLICCHPALLIFCIDRFLQQQQRPPAELKQLVEWAEKNLADALSSSKVIKPNKGKLGNASRSVLKQWQVAGTVCELNAVMFRFLKQQLVKGKPTGQIKRWWKNSASEVLRDSKIAMAKKHSPLQLIVGSQSTCEFSVKSLRSLLRNSVQLSSCENKFNTRLQIEKLASLKQLAYGASHEINNPLANIATGAQALMQSEPNADRRLRLANIYQQSMAAHEMISDLMLFAHPPAPVFETVDLRTLISEILHRAEKKGQSVAATFGPGVTDAILDRTQIIIAIEALLRNAVEAINQWKDGEEDGEEGQKDGNDACPEVSIRIDIASQPSGEQLRIFVVDNGPGYSQQQSRHMFDPFYSGREAGRGLGFGLSKVYRIVKLHDGEILADRNERVGETTFLIRLPLK